MREKIILTFDLEFWYNSGFLEKYVSEEKKLPGDYIMESVTPVLDLLKKHGHRATFFVLGQVAEKYPDLIKKIHDNGHEIGSHGYYHIPLSRLGEKELEKEITMSKNILEKIINKQIMGFRAPNFSLNKKTFWALKIIKQHFHYDSSIHPLNLFKPKNSFYSSLGGIYFRILPLFLYIFFAKILSKQKPIVIYFHPYELFGSAPKIESAPWFKKKIKYWGVKSAWKKFENLMEKFDFISIQEYLNL
jgi:peptidoglycan-N-acetylglucosamine deacetylase